MGNLNETANWDAGVPYFAADAVLTGGPDCPDNIPIQALTNRTAFLKKQIDDAVSGALVTMTAKKLQTARTITMTGDGAWVVSFDGSGNATAAMSLAATGVAAGTYPVVTVDSKGRVTSGRTLTAADIPAVDVSKITGAASQTYVQQAIANLLNGAPGALDTLQELAAALGNDANFAATMTNALAGKANKASTLGGYGITLATQAQAEAGTADDVPMTPLKVAQAIAKLSQQANVPGARKGLKSGAAAAVSLTGTTVSGSNQVSAVSNTAGLLANGSYITGNGIPAGTFITAINGNVLTLSANATASAAGLALTAYPLNSRQTTADALVLSDNAGNCKTIFNINVSANIGTIGANGLDSGILSANTWYHEHIIYNQSNQTTAKLFSLSDTAPSLPAGYSMFARTGTVKTDANKILMNTRQSDRRVQYIVALGSNVPTPMVAASGTSVVAGTAVSVSQFVPPTASKVVITLAVMNVFSTGWASVAPSAAYLFGGSSNAPLSFYNSNANGVNSNISGEFFLESSNIYWGASSSSVSYLYINGWEENL